MAITTFIVGAGASVEYGLPTGPRLQQRIAQLLRPDSAREMVLHNDIMEVWSDLQNDSARDFNALVQTCEWIATALPLSQSIDSFLETHSAKDKLVGALGKFAIAHVIAECERNSALNERDLSQVDFDDLGSSWIGQLWKRGLRGVVADRPEECLKDYKIITFNYDRCVEQFLRLVYRHFFRSSPEEAQAFVDRLNVVHVYGSLGASGSASDFGLIQTSAQAQEAMENIRTYSEQVDEGTSGEIARLLEPTDQVIFLGFSFAKINTDFLGAIPPPPKDGVFDPVAMTRGPVQVLGTSYEMSPWDAQAAVAWVNNWLRHGARGARLEGTTAANFFEGNSITF